MVITQLQWLGFADLVYPLSRVDCPGVARVQRVHVQHQLTATSLTVCWTVVFFFASAGVSAAYLTVSEVFPMETRAMCIALFYAVGTGVGGVIGPQLFAPMVATGKTSEVFKALAIGAILMIFGGIAEIAFGVKERRALEGIAKPLTAVSTAARSATSRAGNVRSERRRAGSPASDPDS